MMDTENSNTYRRTGRLALRALVAVPIISLFAACSSSGTSSGGSTGTTPTTPATSAASSASVASSAPVSSTSTAGGSGQFPGKKATGSPITIGIINPEGGAAISQPEDREAAEAAAKYANDNLGGIAGHVIKTISCKTLEDGASNTVCANKMVQAKVSAVVSTTTGNGDAMAPIITKAGIPYVSVSGSSTGELTSKGAFMWTGGFPGTLAAMAKYSAQQGYKNVTVFVTSVPSAIGGTQQLGVPTFKAAGVTLKVVGITPGTPDATPQVSAGTASKPDAVIVVNDSNGCTSTLKALGTLAPSIPKLVIQPCLDPATVKAVGSGMEGAKVFSVSDTTSGDPEESLFQAVMKKYAPSAPTTGYAVVGYQGMLGLIRASQATTGTSPADLIAAISAAKDVPLPAGHGIKFTCDGKAFPGLTAICSTGEIVYTVKDGKGTAATVVK